jgi:HD-GYP domain-containing protein (c-di-GMP phosphodiesterase class II)
MNFVPVRIGTLRPDEAISFDIFIQIGDRHIHYIKKSDPFDGDRIIKLKSKGVKKLFIPEECENDYLNYLDAGIDKLSDKTISAENKSALVHDAMITDAENAVRNIETRVGYERTEKRMNKMVEFLTGDISTMKKILESAGCSQDNFQHAANVLTLSLGVAGQCGITDTRELLALGLASLFHDLAYTKFDFNPRQAQTQLSSAQWEQYLNHPNASVAMLSDKPYITPGILQLIGDHEEVGENKGFPNKKRLSNLPLVQQILNLCNDYDRYALLTQKTHKDIAKEFFQKRIGYFDLNHIKYLVSLFK